MTTAWRPPTTATLDLPRTSVPDEIRNFLLRQIEEGSLTPGMLVFEKAIAEQLDVGRSSVRTALQRMQQSGFLVPQKGRGWRMQARPTTTDRDASRNGNFDWENPDKYFSASAKLLEVRMALEPTAVSIAAVRASDQEVEGMAALSESFTRAGFADVETLVAADEAFHRSLIQGAQNPIYTSLYDSLVKDIREFRKKSYDEEIHARSAADHDQIVYALRRRNPRLARQAMVSHLWTLYDEVRRQDEGSYPPSQVEREGESLFG